MEEILEMLRQSASRLATVPDFVWENCWSRYLT